jgi:hypothetical protein
MIGALVRYWLGLTGRSAVHVARAPLQGFSPFNLLLTIVTLLAEIAQGKRLSTGALLMQVLLGGAHQPIVRVRASRLA